MSGAARRITPANVPAIAASLQRVAAEVSRRLGHRPTMRVRPAALLSDASAVG